MVLLAMTIVVLLPAIAAGGDRPVRWAWPH